MAIGFARMQYVKRSSGKNMVLKSAYNGKLNLKFEGNCVLPPSTYSWDHKSNRENIIIHKVLLPDQASDKFKDPQYLWNEVEKFEKRKDSQVGIDFVLAIPDDKVISDEQRIEMASEFAKKYFISKGYGVQVDIHPPSQQKSYFEEANEDKKNEKNHHAHFLITPRHFNESGNSFSKKKVNDINPEVRGFNRFTFDGIEWSKLWIQFQNEYFESNGIDLRVDQPAVIAQVHLGPVRMRSKHCFDILTLQNKREELGQIILQDTDIILKKITENKSTFLESDVDLFFHKNIQELEIEVLKEKFWKNSNLVQLFDKNSHQPTMLFSSKHVIEEEMKILRLADRIHQKPGFINKSKIDLNGLTKEQLLAFDKIIKGSSLSCLEGLAGTGKSHLLVALKNEYEANGYNVRAFGPDHATVKVLKSKGFNNACTIHKFLNKNYFSKEKAINPYKEIWIIDESSKIGNAPLLELLKSAERNNIQLIFSGNSYQLSSVDRGGMFKFFCDRYGYAYLGNIQRQSNQIDRDISKQLANGDVSLAIDMIFQTGGFVWCNSKQDSILKTVEKWAEDSLNFPYSSSLIIAHTNKEVRQLNDLVHSVRMARGEVSREEFQCKTIFGNIRVSEGDLIEFRDNSKKLNVTNGERGSLIEVSEDKFVVSVENKKITFNPKEFTAFQLGYAVTCFRSQGSTIDRSYICYNSQMHQKLLYVGRTRHVKKSYCFVSRTDASCLFDIKRQVSRKKTVESTLNYTTLCEIDKFQKSVQTKKYGDDLCSSDSILNRSKGYGFKAWDYFKTSFSSYIERKQDLISDNSFYKLSIEKHITGNIIQIKDENLSISQTQENQPNSEDLYNGQRLLKKSSGYFNRESFDKLSEDIKKSYIKYFEKSENASALYKIVQAESSDSSVLKESVISFKQWQKACEERNQAAFELLRSGSLHKDILGPQGFDILQDRVQRYEQSILPKDSIETKLKENIETLLYKLYPEGPTRRESNGFRFGSNGSLKVTCFGEKKGLYYNFKTKDGGGLIQLIENRIGLNKQEAILWARDFLNDPEKKSAPAHFSTKQFRDSKETNWTSATPPTGLSIPKLSSLSSYLNNNYTLTNIYPYHNNEGKQIFYTLRLENKETGKKIVLPLSFGKFQHEEHLSWKLKQHSSKADFLYNTHLLYQNLHKPVLIVEGEKTADAANKILDRDYIVVSWLGGASSAKDANWKLLHGKDVVIWPDNDPAGFKAATDICKELRAIGVKSLKMVGGESLKDFPIKWDLADPLPVGKQDKFISESILRAENKAISMDRLTVIASQNGMAFKQFNEIICYTDDRLRVDLEKKHGHKALEIEATIISEANKIAVEQGFSRSPKETISMQSNQKERNEMAIDLGLT